LHDATCGIKGLAPLLAVMTLPNLFAMTTTAQQQHRICECVCLSS
jgi:hypothetical protein